MVDMPKKKTHEQFALELTTRHPNIIALGEYTTALKHVKVKCLLDDHEWDVIPNNILRLSGCPECARRNYVPYQQKTHEQFLLELKVIRDDVEVLGQYVGTDEPIRVRCVKHNQVWTTTPYLLLQGSGCPMCKSDKLTNTLENFTLMLFGISPNIKVVGEYTNAATPIKVKCKVDGYEWSPTPNALIQGKGCPKCGGSLKKTNSEFVAELHTVNPNVVALEEYTNAKSPIKTKCLVDGNVWAPTPDSLLQGHGCPKCAIGGYDATKPSCLYIYKFADYCGFGISNNFKTRHRNHKLTFKKSKVDFELLKKYHGSGQQILELEKHLKKNLPITNSGVDGFRTEAVNLENENALIDSIREFSQKIGLQLKEA